MLKNLFNKPLFWITTGSVTVGATTVALVTFSDPQPTSVVYETETTIAETMEATTADITVTLHTETGQSELSINTPATEKPIVSNVSQPESPVDLPPDRVEDVSVQSSPTTIAMNETPEKENPPSSSKRIDERGAGSESYPSQPDNPPAAKQQGKPVSQNNKDPEKQAEVKPQPESAQKQEPVQKQESVQNQEPNVRQTAEEAEPIKACSHKWVWATHTETIHHEATYKQVPVYGTAYDEIVETTKVKCAKCQQLYENDDDYDMRDHCMASFYDITVPTGEVIHHDPELLYMDEILDQKAWDETITVNDYQYCSICKEHK